jgi:hypothetical protein
VDESPRGLDTDQMTLAFEQLERLFACRSSFVSPPRASEYLPEIQRGNRPHRKEVRGRPEGNGLSRDSLRLV